MTPDPANLVVVDGDMTETVHLLRYERPQGPHALDSIRSFGGLYGAALLAELIQNMCLKAGLDVVVLGPPPPDQRDPISRAYPRSYALCSRHPKDLDAMTTPEADVWRVDEFLGLEKEDAALTSLKRLLPNIGTTGAATHAALAVLNDEAVYYRERPDLWPTDYFGPNTWVLLKTTAPLDHPLLRFLHDTCPKRLILLLSANDLRDEGAKLAKGLSWERIVEDAVRWYDRRSNHPLRECAFAVIVFDTVGAMLLAPNSNADPSWRLVFDPAHIEETWERQFRGRMTGYTTCFAAGLALGAVRVPPTVSSLTKGAQHGLAAKRALLRHGYSGHPTDPKAPTCRQPFPIDAIGAAATAPDGDFATVELNHRSVLQSAEASAYQASSLFFVKFLDQKDLVRDLALGGVAASTKIPYARFGALTTVDRNEIEALRAIAQLIATYSGSSAKDNTPLSLAVFGAPGSGKSFGITALTTAQRPGAFSSLEFNMSQFESEDDLISALHRTRDVSLSGRIPVVFWDEFDARWRNADLGWLHHFLSPMERGTFQDGQLLHHVGRAVFVFAGGTAETMEDFVAKHENEESKHAKAPDFMSRLRGYLDVAGPERRGPDDELYVFRRAVILFSILSQHAPQLRSKSTRRFQIEPKVLDAMLFTARYRHGARSMAALIRMSGLSGGSELRAASLPDRAQIRLHVENVDQFLSEL